MSNEEAQPPVVICFQISIFEPLETTYFYDPSVGDML